MSGTTQKGVPGIVGGEHGDAGLADFSRDLAEQRLGEALAKLEERADAVVQLVEEEEDPQAEQQAGDAADGEQLVEFHLNLHCRGAVIQDVESYEKMAEAADYELTVRALREALDYVDNGGELVPAEEVFRKLSKKLNIDFEKPIRK